MIAIYILYCYVILHIVQEVRLIIYEIKEAQYKENSFLTVRHKKEHLIMLIILFCFLTVSVILTPQDSGIVAILGLVLGLILIGHFEDERYGRL